MGQPLPRLHLRQDEEERGARHVRAGARVTPRERVQLVADGEAQELVPGGVELDLVVRWP